MKFKWAPAADGAAPLSHVQRGESLRRQIASSRYTSLFVSLEEGDTTRHSVFKRQLFSVSILFQWK